MKIAPPKIILMSATLPTENQLSDLYGNIVKSHPGMVVKSFSSSEAKIGCALISSSGELFAPHIGSKTVDEIKYILSVIRTNPFVGRFYTFEVLLEMVKIFKKFNLTYPDLTIMFDDPSKANQTNIQQIAYSMLEHLISVNSDSTVEQVCIMEKNIGKRINLRTIFTSDIGRFNKGCIVFSSDPVGTAKRIYKENFDDFMKGKQDRDIFQQVRLDNILENYKRAVDTYKKEETRIMNKKDDGIIKKNKENDKKERKKTEPWQDVSKMEIPIWEFPKELQICSPDHLARVKCDTNPLLGGLICPEDIPSNSSVSIEILTLLASGIGIYSTESPVLDDNYLKSVITLAKKGLIKFIFSDSSIAYGSNLAVSDIIVIDESVSTYSIETESIVNKHSMKTIFQMLGRAGRGGNLSYEARIYTTSSDDNLANKINSYIRGTLDEGSHDEIRNIRKAYETLWN
ncbi:MAG: hypothetical protein Satyrvirus26_11 [Satyrvirus sp.]|uniref:Uncharacterized protein n=1 Tax=Satyrvirus sp. TaxID=2487771 RepID=A0A3G5AEL1_9VIRU|nr:MAG: hypothetical protein Satyrvirus26_11 [Satyrvirus sp.]